MKNATGRMLLCLCLLAAIATAIPVGAQEKWGIKQSGGDWKWVRKIDYRESKDEYMVTGADGSYTVGRKNVVDLAVPKPLDFDKYANSLSKPSADSNDIKGMEMLVDAYKMLKWDVEGYRFLIPVYLKKQEYDKVKSSCERIKKITGRIPEALQGFYWTALLNSGAGSMAVLQRDIRDAIDKGSRPLAAVAYMLRGDINVRDGKLPEALMEGYFRAALVFRDVKDVQPEALFKTWKTLKDLNDRRAEKFKRTLLDEYPNSSYAKELN